MASKTKRIIALLTSTVILGVHRRVWAMLLLAVAVSALASGGVIKWTNDSQDRQQAAYRADQDSRQAQYRAALEAKFQQTIQINGRQTAYSINASVCGWRGFLGPTLNDTRIPEARRKEIDKFLRSQVTVPSTFDCKTLPKNPPKP